MAEPSDIPQLGDLVYFYDEDRRVYAAHIAYCFEKFGKGIERPICNLVMTKHDGGLARRLQIEPAYHDGSKWRMINKYSWPDEIPKDDCNWTPMEGMKRSSPGHAETLSP